jgi:hypothetical protein
MTLADKVQRYLTEQGGSIESETGRGITARMAEVVGADLGVLNGVLARLERNGVVVREVRGRRTYRVALSQYAGNGARKAPAVPRISDAPNRPGHGRRRRPVQAGAISAGTGAGARADPEVAWLRAELADHTDLIAGLQHAVEDLTRRLTELETAQQEAGGRFLRRRAK